MATRAPPVVPRLNLGPLQKAAPPPPPAQQQQQATNATMQEVLDYQAQAVKKHQDVLNYKHTNAAEKADEQAALALLQ